MGREAYQLHPPTHPPSPRLVCSPWFPRAPSGERSDKLAKQMCEPRLECNGYAVWSPARWDIPFTLYKRQVVQIPKRSSMDARFVLFVFIGGRSCFKGIHIPPQKEFGGGGSIGQLAGSSLGGEKKRDPSGFGAFWKKNAFRVVQRPQFFRLGCFRKPAPGLTMAVNMAVVVQTALVDPILVVIGEFPTHVRNFLF